MAPSDAAIAAAAGARESALLAWLDDPDRDSALAALEVCGPDAASFLHSQVTNEVEALEVGEGNLSARVTRTGHLVAHFSLHRLEPSRFLLVVEWQQLATLQQDLDAYLFADQVQLEARDWSLLAVQGPRALSVASAMIGEAPASHWVEGAAQRVEAGWLLNRSLTGDTGLLIAAEGGAARAELAAACARMAERQDALLPEPPVCDQALEILRIEAGLPRVGVDTPGRSRRLHETGLEQLAVSYTKGCYLGQEVIARARTYGSVPRALRGLALRGGEQPDAGRSQLARLAEVGAPVQVDASRVGQLCSRTWSPVAQAPVVLAYLARSHRTPGTILQLPVSEGEPIEAEVLLLPIFRAADQATRVATLYDRAIRVFAAGEEEQALGLLEQALRLDPGFADGYEAIGVILGRAGRYHEAIDFFRRLEEVAPEEPMVNTNLSLYYMKLGDKATAEAEAGRATEKSFAKASAGRRGASTDAAQIAAERREARQQDAERKREMFGKVLAFDPEDPIALFGLGQAHATLEQWPEAEAALARAAAVDRRNSAIYLAHGKALEALERTEEALEVYRAGMQVASDRGDLMPLKEMEHRVLLLGARR